MKWMVRAGLGIVASYVLLVAIVFAMMHRPPEEFARGFAKLPPPAKKILPFPVLWNEARAGGLRVGEEAPGFDLETLDKKSRVRLAEFRGSKPVVLVFGSYT